MVIEMREKQGLFSDTVKIVIAVLCIFLLFVGAQKLYAVTLGAQDVTARKALDLIEAKIAVLHAGQNTSFPLKGPSGAYLTAWGKEDTSRPDRCALKSCVCICEDVGKGSPAQGKVLPFDCQKKGICRDVEVKNVSVKNSVSVTLYDEQASVAAGLPIVKGSKQETLQYARFPENVLGISMMKSSEGVEIIVGGSA